MLADWYVPFVFMSFGAGAVLVVQRVARQIYLAQARRAGARKPPTLQIRPVEERQARWDALTLRQREIARCALAGKQNSEIAQELNLAAGTVAFHLKQVYRTLDIHSRFELVRFLRDVDID